MKFPPIDPPPLKITRPSRCDNPSAAPPFTAPASTNSLPTAAPPTNAPPADGNAFIVTVPFTVARPVPVC